MRSSVRWTMGFVAGTFCAASGSASTSVAGATSDRADRGFNGMPNANLMTGRTDVSARRRELGGIGRQGGVHAAIQRRREPTGDRTGLAVADRTAVELHDRRHVAGGPGDEELLQPTDLLLEDRRFAHRDAFLHGELEDDVSRDSR